MMVDTPTTTEVDIFETPTNTLTLADRCDRDNGAAAAQVAVRLQNGSVLMFCKHHYEQHEPALKDAGAEVLVDQRELLFEQDRLTGSEN